MPAAAESVEPGEPGGSVEMAETLRRLEALLPDAQRRWSEARPFHYVVIDDFLPAPFAEAIFTSYPVPGGVGWDDTTFVHQRSKYQMRSGFPAPIDRFFQISASAEFRELLSRLTGIPKLLADPELIGGGLHQTAPGGFLDVHVDYNVHPVTRLHRRMNLLVYMNKDWTPEYGGYLELWDLRGDRKQLESVAPVFNRAVLFETNEISFHGHPKPLAAPPGTTRKSLALYYYTAEREHVAPEHNTIYRQTTGVAGYVKTSASTLQALVERTREQGLRRVVRDMLRKAYRRARRLPPANG